MQLTLYTDYSLRTLVYLNQLKEGETATINDVAEYYNVSRNHLMKVVYNLSQKGYIQSIRGKGGGIRLAKPGSEINVGRVVRDMEPNFHVVECFNPEASPCAITSNCALIPVLREATDLFLSVLDKYTIDTVLKNKAAWSTIGFTDLNKK